MSNLVYLHGSYFGNNFGDVLLVDIFAKKISQLGYSVKCPYASKEFSRLTNLPVGRNSDDNAIAAVYCGGGYFGEPSTRRRSWSVRNSFRHGLPYIFFIKNNIPYVILGVGFGPITYLPFNFFAKKIFADAEKISVRDVDSVNHLEVMGFRKSVTLTSDAVLTLKSEDIPKGALATVKEKLNKDCNGYYIGVHLTNKYINENDFLEIALGLKDAVGKIKGARVIFIIDGKSRRGKKLKQEFDAEYLASMVEANVHSIWKYDGHWDLVSLLNNMDMVITSKLHVGIVSSVLNRNVLAIPYHSKTKRFYNQIGQPQRCLNSDVNRKSVCDFIISHVEAKGVVIPSEIIKCSHKNFSILHDFLKSRVRPEGKDGK